MTSPPAFRSRFFQRDWKWWFMIAVLLLVAAVRFRLLDCPLERDEGEYAYAGQLMLQGIPPYEQAYNMKFPGTYAAYAFIMILFGQTPAGIHFGLICVTAFTALMLFWLGKKMLDTTAGVVAATCYAVLAASSTMLGLAGHATHFAACCVTAGLCLMCLARQNSRWPAALAAGIFFGCAVLMKQHAAFVALWASLAFTATVWRKAGLSPRGKFWLIAAFGAGIVLPFGVCCLLLWGAGVFGKFWFWTVDYAHQYATMVPSYIPLTKIHRVFLFHFDLAISEFPLLWLFPAAGLGLIWFDSRLRGLRLWLVGFCLAATATVFPGLYFRPHYFLLMLPAIALLAGCGISAASQLWRRRAGASQLGDWPVPLYAVVLLVAIFSNPGTWFVNTPAQVQAGLYGGQIFSAAQDVAKYIAANSTPDMRVAVLGSEPEICFLAHRHSATGYMYTYPLMEPQLFARKMQAEMIGEIERASPEFVIFEDERQWDRRSDSDPGIFNWWESYRARYTCVGVADQISRDEIRFYWGEPAARPGLAKSPMYQIFRRNAPTALAGITSNPG